MKIIIIGDGKVGYKLARQLSTEKYDVVLIDSDEKKLKFATDHLDIACVAGNGADAEVLKQAGAKRVVPLRVSGPFHSPLLYGAGEQLQKELEKISFNKIRIPYIANLTAEYVTDSKEISELLRKQVYSPVRFEQTLRKLITDGFDTFIEIGPGRTLTGFVKKTAKEMQCEGITCINIEKEEDLSQLITE